MLTLANIRLAATHNCGFAALARSNHSKETVGETSPWSPPAFRITPAGHAGADFGVTLLIEKDRLGRFETAALKRPPSFHGILRIAGQSPLLGAARTIVPMGIDLRIPIKAGDAPGTDPSLGYFTRANATPHGTESFDEEAWRTFQAILTTHPHFIGLGRGAALPFLQILANALIAHAPTDGEEPLVVAICANGQDTVCRSVRRDGATPANPRTAALLAAIADEFQPDALHPAAPGAPPMRKEIRLTVAANDASSHDRAAAAAALQVWLTTVPADRRQRIAHAILTETAPPDA